ncbi:hypothetical protein YC2023_058980 [Brassica napus]
METSGLVHHKPIQKLLFKFWRKILVTQESKLFHKLFHTRNQPSNMSSICIKKFNSSYHKANIPLLNTVRKSLKLSQKLSNSVKFTDSLLRLEGRPAFRPDSGGQLMAVDMLLIDAKCHIIGREILGLLTLADCYRFGTNDDVFPLLGCEQNSELSIRTVVKTLTLSSPAPKQTKGGNYNQEMICQVLEQLEGATLRETIT